MDFQQSDWHEAASVFIDPQIQDGNAFPDLAHYNQHPHSYYSYGHPQAGFPAYSMGKTEVTTTLRPPFAPRHWSPSDHTYSTCSSSQSPPSESEGSYDNPSTPEYAMSPYVTHDNFTSHNQLSQLAGLTNVYIKPEDYLQEPPNHNMDTPEFPTRELSMSSNDSNYDLVSMNQPETTQIPGTLAPADTIFVKHEMCTEPASYPPLEDEDEDNMIDQQCVQADDDQDGDYRPRATHHKTTPNTSRVSRHCKRTGSSASTPATKKARREPVPSTSSRSANKLSPNIKGSLACGQCRDVFFRDEGGLQKHIKQQHTRPFICVFHFAGCTSTFASKNEWKRHVASQHLLLNYWLCDQEACAKLSNTSASLTKATGTSRHRSSYPCQSDTECSSLPNGAIFNRKDLYTQHLRRMHIPPSVKKQLKAKKTVPEWEERVRVCQDEAHRLRCQLPEHMACPATGCTFQATGANAWDERMEHVAKHLERAASNLESTITFGGTNDPTLMNWVLRPDVAVVQRNTQGRLELHNPLKPQSTTKTLVGEYSEEDAPGEEIDD